MSQPSPQTFMRDAEAFLAANAGDRLETGFQWGEGADGVGLLPDQTPAEEAESLRAAKLWKAVEFDAGFGWVTGPTAFGGAGLPAAYERAYRTMKAKYDTPSEAPFAISLGMVAPTILTHGSIEARERYLRQLWRGDIIACQLFSEPAAGSDLANAQTRAVRDDKWVITGQKVWTSGAQYSDIGEVICRTDPTVSKHRGLTAFIVDMRSPGVEVRPLRQMTGGASFNEVFFDGVRVADDLRLGEVNQGWTVALTTLMNERATVGGGGMTGGVSDVSFLERLLALAKYVDKNDEPTCRQAIANLYMRFHIAKWSHMRGMSQVQPAQLPGPEMSLGKLSLTQSLQSASQLIGSLLGPRLAADTGEWGTFAWTEFVLGVPGIRLAGGTDEVMRNILAERVLGLPREPIGPSD